MGVLRSIAAREVRAQRPVSRYIGVGSSSLLTTKLKDEVKRAAKLHTPIAVAANKVGNRYELAAKLILKAHVTPNLVNRKKMKKRVEL